MNKTELIDAMAADSGITKAAAKKALESFLGNVEGSLRKGNRVSLVMLKVLFVKEIEYHWLDLDLGQ